jgi:hypothetical protein
MATMRLPNAVHDAGDWRIREIAHDFVLEDVWSLPVEGDAGDFPRLVQMLVTLDPLSGDSVAARVLWRGRDLLGRVLGIGRVAGGPDGISAAALPIPGTDETTLATRLPADLRGTVDGMEYAGLPFTPLYRTDREFAAEISNATVHGAAHIAWAGRGDGTFGGQLAIYVKPRGALGQAYLTAIRPFRYLVVYPALMRQIAREWEAREA